MGDRCIIEYIKQITGDLQRFIQCAGFSTFFTTFIAGCINYIFKFTVIFKTVFVSQFFLRIKSGNLRPFKKIDKNILIQIARRNL